MQQGCLVSAVQRGPNRCILPTVARATASAWNLIGLSGRLEIDQLRCEQTNWRAPGLVSLKSRHCGEFQKRGSCQISVGNRLSKRIGYPFFLIAREANSWVCFNPSKRHQKKKKGGKTPFTLVGFYLLSSAFPFLGPINSAIPGLRPSSKCKILVAWPHEAKGLGFLNQALNAFALGVHALRQSGAEEA